MLSVIKIWVTFTLMFLMTTFRNVFRDIFAIFARLDSALSDVYIMRSDFSYDMKPPHSNACPSEHNCGHNVLVQ